ncbi:retron system putative HNH endonuclease [Methylomagnum sp.]
MRAISKRQEPKALEEYRCKPDAVYDGPLFTAVKQAIREQLLREQGYLCAYCMRRISDQQMKVEHWHCQDNYPDEQLDYQNMLGACLGHEGEPYTQQTCDTRKGNKELKYNPANVSHRIENHIQHLGNGKVQSDDSEFDRQLNEVLNLNQSRLVKNRQAVWDAVHNMLSQKPGSRTSVEVRKILDQWDMPISQVPIREYSAVAIYYLRKRLKSLEKPNPPTSGR